MLKLIAENQNKYQKFFAALLIIFKITTKLF